MSPMTVFVLNIPLSMHWKGLWVMFRFHGEVLVAFIPEKRTKFKGRRQIWKKKRRGEDNVVMGSNGKMEKKEYEKLKVDDRVERGVCSLKSRFGMANTENEDVRIEKNFIAVQVHVEEEKLWKLQICVVDEELFGIVKQNDWGYLREFFVSIKPWLEFTMVEERVAWIDVAGVPFHCWNNESFKRIALLVCQCWFPIRVVEQGLSEVEDVSRSLMGNNGGDGKNIEQGRAESVVSESESVLGLRSDKLSGGERGWEEEAINAMFVEKPNDIVGSQSLHQNVFSLEEELFGAVRAENEQGERDFHGSSNHARADVINMGFSLERSISKIQREKSDEAKEGSIPEGESYTVENHLVLPNRKNQKSNGRKVRSMLDIQDKVLSINEKRKRDRAMKKQRGKGKVDREDTVVNASLSDLDISNRKRVILREARKAWEIGKKLEFSVRGDDREVVEDIMRLEERQ
ncbi:hypothetical protein Goshw_019470 [Gossypium schwendimanii]|uniref:DUF4283 domain-containing protein n=1 Tax=Gossypium schwendimanii TaxID=34291 RepID=A0A7J9MIL3_GOSSC|nr:hypothetical protein [Gossypium schwendimanii]